MSWFGFGFRRSGAALAQRYAAVHARFLERALAVDTSDLRVPARRVDQGGYDLLLSVPGGRERCEQWWLDAFAYLDSRVF